MSALARWLVLGLGVASFLAAAKAHGRQLRIERELAGYWEVTFGGQNPAWVEVLWRRERLLYWGAAGVFALCTIGFRLFAPRFEWSLPLQGMDGERSVIGVLVFHVIVPLIGAFVATGFWSLARFALAVRAGAAASGSRPQDWLSKAALGSAGWWALTVVMCAALFVFAWRRPA